MNVSVIQPSEIPKDWYDSEIAVSFKFEDLRLDSSLCFCSFYKYGSDVVYIVNLKSYVDNVLIEISDEELDILKYFLQSISIIGYKLSPYLSILRYQWNIDFKVVHDVFILARMLQLDKQGLKDIVSLIKPHLLLKHYDDIVEFPVQYDLDDESLRFYSALDVLFLFHIINYYREFIERNFKFYTLELDYLNAVIRLQSAGLGFSQAAYDAIKVKYDDLYQKSLNDLSVSAGFPVNVNSNKDLHAFLVDKLGCCSDFKTASGSVSFSLESIDDMVAKAILPEQSAGLFLVKQAKFYASLLKSLESLYSYVVNMRLFFSIEQIGHSGSPRCYSKEYSVSQCPLELRGVIVPFDTVNNRLCIMDWLSAEFYIVAYWSKCKSLLDVYNNGLDLYEYVGNGLFGNSICSRLSSVVLKGAVLSIIYTMDPYVVADKLGCSFSEAQGFIDKFFNVYPEVKLWRDKLISLFDSHSMGFTLLGRAYKYSKSVAVDSIVGRAVQYSLSEFTKLFTIKVGKSDVFDYRYGIYHKHILESSLSLSPREIRYKLSLLNDFSDVLPNFIFKDRVGLGSDLLACEEVLR